MSIGSSQKCASAHTNWFHSSGVQWEINIVVVIMIPIFAFLAALICPGLGYHFSGGQHKTFVNLGVSKLTTEESTFQKVSATIVRTNREIQLQSAIRGAEWARVDNILTFHPDDAIKESGNFVFVIIETCRRTNHVDHILPFLGKLPPEIFHMASEGDIIPFLSGCRPSQLQVAEDVMRFLHSNGVLFSAKAFSILLSRFGKLENEDKLEDILDWCFAEGICADAIFLNSVIDAYIRCGNIQRAMFVLGLGLTAFEANAYQTMMESQHLKICSDSPWKYSSLFMSPKSKANTRSFNTALKGLAGEHKAAAMDAADDLLRVMALCGLKPNAITVNTLVHLAVQLGDFRAADKLLGDPPTPPTSEAYTSLIAGYAAAGCTQEAFDTYDLMRARKVPPSAFTFTALMKAAMAEVVDACGPHGHLANREDAGDHGSRRARDQTGAVSNLSLTRASRLLALASDTKEEVEHTAEGDQAQRAPLLAEAERAALFGSFVIGMCSLATDAAAAQRPREANRFMLEAQTQLLAMEERALPVDSATTNAFIRALCACHRVRDALLVFRCMGQHGNVAQADDFTFSILFTALGRLGMGGEAMELYRTRARGAVATDEVVVNSLMYALAGGPDPADALHLHLELVPTSSSTSSSSSAHRKALKKADGRFSPSKVTFTILFVALTRVLRAAGAKGARTSSSSAGPQGRHWGGDSDDDSGAQQSQRQRRLTSTSEFIQDLPLPLTRSGIPALGSDEKADRQQEKGQGRGRGVGSGDTRQRRDAADQTVLQDADRLLHDLYRSMRFDRGIGPDDKMAAVLVQLFAAVAGGVGETSFSSWPQFGGFSTNTATLIFEDLVILGFDPRDLRPIMFACGYSSRKEQELLQENSPTLSRMRNSATTNLIFRKYRWNSMESGWNPFF